MIPGIQTKQHCQHCGGLLHTRWRWTPDLYQQNIPAIRQEEGIYCVDCWCEWTMAGKERSKSYRCVEMREVTK